MTSASKDQASDYFLALQQALDGLDTFMRDETSTANKHSVIAAIADE